MATSATPKGGATSGGRTLRRALGVLLVVAGAVIVGAAAISQTAAFRDWLRRQVVVRLNARLAGQVAVGSLEGNLFGALVATDVRVVLEGQRVLAVRRLAATYDVLALITGSGLRIRSLEGDGVALQLIADERGWNVARLRTAPAVARENDLEVNLERVRITDGALRVIRPGRVWRFRNLTLAGTATFGSGARGGAFTGLSFVEQGSRLRLEEAAGRLAFDPGAGWMAKDVRIRTVGSQLALDGRIGPRGARRVDAHLRVPHLAAAEVRALFGRRAPRSDWAGELHAAGPDAAVAVTGELRAAVAVDGAEREVGRVRLDGTLDLRDDTPLGELHAALEHVDVGGIIGPALPASDLTGSLRLAARVDAPRTVIFGLDLRDPRVGTATLGTLAVTGSADGETVRFEAAGASSSGAARLTGAIVPKARRFDLRLTAKDLDPALLSGRAELGGAVNATVTLVGEGFTPATARGDVGLAIAPSRIGAVAITGGALTARTAAGRLVVERATVASNAGSAELSGDLALASADAPGVGGLRGEVRVTDLRPLAELFGRPGMRGVATVTAGARGRPGALDATVTVKAGGLAGPGWQVATLDAELAAERLGDPQGEARVHARGRNVAVAERRLSDGELSGWWRRTAATARAGIDLSGRDGAAEHRLTAEMTLGANETRVTVSQLRFDHRGRSWVATGTPVLVHRAGRLTIEDLAVRSADGSGRLHGVVTRAGESDLELEVDGLDLGVLAGLVPADVAGRLVGRAHLGGTLAAPRLDADVVVAAPTLGGVRYDELRARLVAGGGRAELHGRLAQAPAQALVVDGIVPVRVTLEPWRCEIAGDLEARLRADDVDLAFFASLWPGLATKVGGTITGDVAVTGPWRVPEARGTIVLAGGRGHVVPLGLTYDPVDLALRLEGRVVSIERLAIQSGSGTLTGGGNARLGGEGTTMDARFEAKSFPLFANQYGRGAASGWLWISGTMAAPVVEGSLETDGLVLQIPEVLPSGVRRADPTIVVIGPGAPEPVAAQPVSPGPPTVPGIFDRAAVTVQLAVPRNAWVRRSDANVELEGWMTGWKKPGEDFHLAGDIRGVRGWYVFQGKKFALAEGSVRFSGQSLDPVLDITATHRAGEYLVRLRVGGTITKPALTLESEPALDQADVLAVLLFGAPANQLSRSQSTGLREQALGIAGSYVASELRQSVANALGVDDLQFDTGTAGLQDARVSIGKYVADDIFVSLAHRFGAESVEEVRIEYVIRPGWSLETSTDTLGRSGVDLFWKRRY
jgi:autotransporter translocation and assembly factor TamB